MNYGYRASFPSLVNVDGSPVYVMALTDDGALIKKYAMVDLQDYTKVVAADTIQETWSSFVSRYGSGETVSDPDGESITIRPTDIQLASVEGNTYAYLRTDDAIYRIPVDGNEEILFLDSGRSVEITVYGLLHDGVYAAELKE
jgi:hypothetical protein